MSTALRKTFVLDTNVILHDPTCILRFGDNRVVLPITVLEEVDKFKKDLAGLGLASRKFNREMSALIKVAKKAGESLHGGITLPNGGTLQVINGIHVPRGMEDTNDHRILNVAIENAGAILVTKDLNLRVKADANGVVAEDYQNDKVDYSSLYTGTVTIPVDSGTIDRIYTTGAVSQEYLDTLLDVPVEIHENCCITFVCETNPKQSALAIMQNGVAYVIKDGDLRCGISARNREQRFALRMLLDDRIKLVTLIGKAGTGKTLLAIAAGLHKVGNGYRKLLVGRPAVDMGDGLGFLPGDLEEKLAPWMQPIKDNLELLLRYGGDDDIAEKAVGRTSAIQDMKDQGLLEYGSLSHMRGRSIPKQFMIIDESQNLTPHEVKTIITRAGEGTKIILTGDPDQIDKSYLDAGSNGLSYAVDRFKGQAIAGTITLTKGERSELAELAANLL